jgi:regulatory protein
LNDEITEPTERMVTWAKNSSLYRISRKMMSEAELRQALSRKAATKFKDISPDLARKIADAGIAWCNEHKFLNDETYAAVKTASAQRSGRSKRRIAMDLASKGIDIDLITSSIEEVDDLKSAVIFARKKAFGPFRRGELDEKRKNKEFSAMARIGFSGDVANRIMRMSHEEAEEILG